MKKVIGILLVIVLCCALFAACASPAPAETSAAPSADTAAPAEETQAAATTSVAAEPAETTQQFLRVNAAYYNSDDNEPAMLETEFLELVESTTPATEDDPSAGNSELKVLGAHQLTLSPDATIEYSEDLGPTTTTITPEEFVQKFEDPDSPAKGMMFTATITADNYVTALEFYYTE